MTGKERAQRSTFTAPGCGHHHKLPRRKPPPKRLPRRTPPPKRLPPPKATTTKGFRTLWRRAGAATWDNSYWALDNPGSTAMTSIARNFVRCATRAFKTTKCSTEGSAQAGSRTTWRRPRLAQAGQCGGHCRPCDGDGGHRGWHGEDGGRDGICAELRRRRRHVPDRAAPALW